LITQLKTSQQDHQNARNASTSTMPASLTQKKMDTSSCTSLPPARKSALEKFLSVVPNITDEGTSFTRKFLRSALGGNLQSLIVKITDSMTNLAKKHQVSCFLCPNLEQNPWAPASPGQHGFMFVGLGLERDSFLTTEVCSLFIETRQHRGANLECQYLGLYAAWRVNALTVEEWHTLSHDVKTTYSKTTKEKNNSPQSVNQIMADYNAGTLHVPCVQLICVGYDEELCLALLERSRVSATTCSPAKRPHGSGAHLEERSLRSQKFGHVVQL